MNLRGAKTLWILLTCAMSAVITKSTYTTPTIGTTSSTETRTSSGTTTYIVTKSSTETPTHTVTTSSTQTNTMITAGVETMADPEIIDCGRPDAPDNGFVSVSSTLVNSTAMFYCNTGYRLNGSNITTCMASGNWSHVVPTCIIVDCGPPGAPENGLVQVNSTQYGSYAWYYCDIGYRRYGSYSICMESENWSQPVPVCIVDCGLPDYPVYGYRLVYSTIVYGTVQYYCGTGYRLNGSDVSTCTISGNWSHSAPTCNIVDCGQPDAPENGRVDVWSTWMYGVAGYHCDSGYRRSGSYYTICRESGKWLPSVPLCNIIETTTSIVTTSSARTPTHTQTTSSTKTYVITTTGVETTVGPKIIDCGPPRTPENGYVQVNSTLYRSYAWYYCDVGYRRIGSYYIICTVTETWSQPVPVCIVDCGLPDSPVYGHWLLHSSLVYGTADYYCYFDSRLNGSNVTTCTISGNWSHTAPSCNIVDCGQPEAPANGRVDVWSTRWHGVAGYHCDAGYRRSGSYYTICRESGNWFPSVPSCNKIDMDCGPPEVPENGGVRVSSTRLNGTAVYYCDVGYRLNGSNVATCRSTGYWSSSVPRCYIILCLPLQHPSNGKVDVSSNDNSYGTFATYTCDDGHSIVGVTDRICLHTGEWSETEPVCREDLPIITTCLPDTDLRGTVWPETSPGQVAVKNCTHFKEGTEGRITRNCSIDGIWRPAVYNCRRNEFAKAAQEISAIVDNPTKEGVEDALSSLSNLTKRHDAEDGGLFEAEIEEVTSFLGKLVDVSRNVSVTQAQSDAFFSTTSNLFDKKNENTWNSIRQNSDEQGPVGAVRVLEVIGPYTDIVAESLTENDTSREIHQANMDLTIVRLGENKTDVSFPKEHSQSVDSSSLFLPKESLNGSLAYSAILYPDLNGIIPAQSSGRALTNTDLNSAVLGLRLIEEMSSNGQLASKVNLTKPVLLRFGHLKRHLVDPQCSFWNFESNEWDENGCELKTKSDGATVCECSHLTNFAILMSPWKTSNVDSMAIGVISYLGCGLSSACLLITVAVHIFLWRYVKADRTVILMNMCVALVISYIIFLAGVRQTENEDSCTAVAILLQYVYLAVFFLMLAEGVEIGIIVLFLRPPLHARLRWMLLLAWGLPAVIVAISVGVTKLRGYGNADFCWLSTESHLIWSFVGPALTIILINFVLLILVMRAMFKTKAISEKSIQEKSKVSIRCLCVLLPLMGCSWVLGVFYVSEEVSWIQYVFALCNSLQGAAIFIIHCLFNTKIRKAIRKTRQRHSDSMRTSKQTSHVFLPRISHFYKKSGRYDPPQVHDVNGDVHGSYTSSYSNDESGDSYRDKLTTVDGENISYSTRL